MEAETDRLLRRSIPELAPRFAVLTVGAYLLNLLQAQLRPKIESFTPTGSLREFCIMGITIVVMTGTFIGLGGLVACYYYRLRERRVHTALSEGGLALRASYAGVFAFTLFVLALMINDRALAW